MTTRHSSSRPMAITLLKRTPGLSEFTLTVEPIRWARESAARVLSGMKILTANPGKLDLCPVPSAISMKTC